MAMKNKAIGAKFEGDVRKSLREKNQFIYTKGVSSAGIDLFCLKDDVILFAELKSHAEYNNSEYNDAYKQLIANFLIVEEFLRCTDYSKDKVNYVLFYYVRNKFLILNDLNNNKVTFQKERNVNIIKFIQNSLESYGIE